MKRLAAATGLGSRIALRTFLLFCLCSVTPVILFAFLTYRFVSSELHDAAASRLSQASKRYGILIYERLRTIEETLGELGRMQLAGQNAERIGAIPVDRVKVVSVTAIQPALPRRAALEVRTAEGRSSIRLRVTAVMNGRAVEVIGEPQSGYLWDTDAAETPDATLCVFADSGLRLHCAGEYSPSTDRDSRLSGQWHLFLRSQYGAGDWFIRAEQSSAAALPSLRAFEITVLIAAALAVATALLVSSIQIRRSHGPLKALTGAALRLSRGRFDTRVRISSHDEYAGLGEAFNLLAARLRRQFRLLSAFTRIDQLMLARPAVEPIIESLLPKIAELLHCDAAVIALADRDGGGLRIYSIRRDSAMQQSVRASIPANGFESLTSKGITSLDARAWAALGLSEVPTAEIASWKGVPIRVGGEARGLLAIGVVASRWTNDRGRDRHARRLAHRLAVALGGEDRERSLVKQAYYDPLTGLANRQLFKDRLEHEISRARRSETSVALIFIDLDRFKNVNDSLGHTAGDALLKVAATRLTSRVRESDSLARLSGDEFTAIIPDAPVHVINTLAARMLTSLREPILIEGMECVAQASMGIAVFPQDGLDAETLIRNADTAMYRAKARGGDAAVFFEESMNAQAVRRLWLEQRLRQALANDELEQHYQLKVRAVDEVAAGVEALARWTDIEAGPISPAEFIPIAEDSGLIEQLDKWSILAACKTADRWRSLDVSVGHIAVNVSLRHVRDHRFVEFVAECLREWNLPGEALELEITESTLAENPRALARVLEDIRALGIRIAIDDFGTGYSSMAMLQKVPIDTLKIDRAFISGCTEDANAAALLRALIDVARGLGKEVVAEGVETVAQAAFLRAHGCHFLQGFLFSRPSPAIEFERLSHAGRPRLRRAE